MADRTYYVLCEDNCRFEGMTKEQILAAIAEATGVTPSHIDDAFVSKVKESRGNTAITFWVGTQAQFNAITPAPNANLFQLKRDSNGKWYAITDVRVDAETLIQDHNVSPEAHSDLREIIHNLTLPSASWSGSSSPYTQNVTIGGITANSKVDIMTNATALAQMIADDVRSIYIENSNGTLTAYAVNEKPTADISVQVAIKYILKHLGTVAAVANLPSTGNNLGDVYYVTAEQREYVWNGTAWQLTSNALTDSEIDAILNS